MPQSPDTAALTALSIAQRWLWLEEMWPEWNQPGAEPPDVALSAEQLQRRRR